MKENLVLIAEKLLEFLGHDIKTVGKAEILKLIKDVPGLTEKKLNTVVNILKGDGLLEAGTRPNGGPGYTLTLKAVKLLEQGKGYRDFLNDET